MIRIRAMEKLRRKTSLTMDSCSWAFSIPPSLQELYMTSLEIPKSQKEDHDEEDDVEEFVTVKSCLSCCSSAMSRDTFFSVRTNLSRSSSLNRLDYYSDFLNKRLMFQELSHCEGWPFGLCRKAVLLPPLPKSPSESWSWRKHPRSVKLPYL